MQLDQYGIHSDVEDNHWWWRARREILAEAIALYAPPTPPSGLRLAEVGCGCGGNLAMMARFGTVLGAESSPAALAYLRRKRAGVFQVIQHTIPDPLRMTFHVIGMFDVLEHIPDDLAAMSWVSHHLEPGGIAVITVPAFRFLWTEQDEAVHHLRRYTPKGLALLLPPELELAHLTCFNTLLFVPILLARLLMRLLRRRGRAPRSHLAAPPSPVNWVLYRLFRLESRVAPRLRLPLGVSLLLVARRRG